MEKFTEEQIIEAVRIYYEKARTNPDDFSDTKEYTDNEGIDAGKFLVSILKETV